MFQSTRTKSQEKELEKLMEKNPSPSHQKAVKIGRGIWVVPKVEFKSEIEKETWINTRREILKLKK